MVEEPTKTLRGALALLRGASCQVLTRTIANPAIRSQLDRMVDFAAARLRVNATNKNKRILIERRGFGRMNSPGAGRAMKQCFHPRAQILRPAASRGAAPTDCATAAAVPRIIPTMTRAGRQMLLRMACSLRKRTREGPGRSLQIMLHCTRRMPIRFRA